MSGLRNRMLAPPPPRHPAARPPSPNPQHRPGILNVPPPPVHPSLPPRPPPSPRPDVQSENFDAEPTHFQEATPLGVPHTTHIRRLPPPVPPNLPSNPRPPSENVTGSTSGVDVEIVGAPVPSPQHPNISPELPPPVDPVASSFHSTASSSTTQQPVYHSRVSPSSTSGMAYETTLSEKELRDLYDDEEIDRFLHLFSVFVNEVKLSDDGQSTVNVEFTAAADGTVAENPEENDDKDWLSLTEADQNIDMLRDGSKPQTVSEQIAQTFIVPYLPKTTKAIPPFTILRFRLTVQRLYLALEPGYQFVVDELVSLALWEHKSMTLGFCLGYWLLWVYNLLFPTFVFYLLYVLLRRKMYPYPSLSQLREHRRHIDKASEFGEELQGTLTATSSFGLLDAWKALRAYNKNKANEKMKQSEDATSVISVEAAATDGDTTAAENSAEKVHEQDIKALGLEALCELIDGLERLKNLFLWRKPSASYAFSIVLGVIGFMTLVLPAQWLAKTVYFVLGFAFWHAPPILAALPAGDHRRLLALLHNVPTDADYAMELIAQRVARGQDIKPLNRKRRTTKKLDASGSEDVTSQSPSEVGKPGGLLKQGASVLKTVASTGYQAIGGRQFIHNTFAPAVVRGAGPQDNSRSYPAQYGKTPGVITISTNTLYFTPLLAGPKLEIPMGDIVGMKKAAPKGISFKVKDASQENGERKERFLLVYERDELFGRLVGTGGKKWMKF